MIFIYSLIFMASLVAAQRPGGNDEHLFHGTNEPTCCECVPYLDCKDGQLINPSKLNKPGQQTRGDVQKCNGLVDFCCLFPNPPSNCSHFQPGPKAKFIFDLESKEACECTSWELCHPDKVVTDGNGPHSDKGLRTHSKCQKLHDVCCQSSPGHENAAPKVGVRVSQQQGGCECVPQEQCVNGNVNTDGVGIIDPRVRENNNCPNHGDVCCKVPENGVGNIKNRNYFALTCFVTLVSVLKGILTCQ